MTDPAQQHHGSSHIDRTLIDVLERLRNRFFGKYRGVVTDVDAGTMRVKASVPAVLGEQPSGWARPSVPFAGPSMGFAFLPEVGTGVWIEFEGGDVSYPIWVGCYWHDGEQPSDASSSVLAIVTKVGQKILLDTSGTITVSDQNGNTVTLDSSGISLQGASQSVALSNAGVNINNGALQVTA
jgi:Type VI secretion system/phage-baseplate injector OB domain